MKKDKPELTKEEREIIEMRMMFWSTVFTLFAGSVVIVINCLKGDL